MGENLHFCIDHDYEGEVPCPGKHETEPACSPDNTDNPYYEPLRSPVFEQVKLDLDARDRLGYEAHHKRLTPDDERDWLIELYQELLDATVYLKAELMRREESNATGHK